MNVRTMMRAGGVGAAAVITAVISSCDNNLPSTGTPNSTTSVVLASHSSTPVLLKGLPSGVTAFSLIGSDDVLSESPSYIFGGSADGAGLLKNSDGTFTILVNHEDNFAVSRVKLDATLKPTSGEYLVNSTAGRYRLCSATLVTPEEHGFGPLFITAGESNEGSQILAVAPDAAPNVVKYVDGFGRWQTENAVPLPKTAYPNKTVVVIGDDDSGAEGGQLAMYVSTTIGDLDNGNVYVMARADNNTNERSMIVGQTYPVAFRQIVGHKTMTGRQINLAGVGVSAIQFGRTEDVDYRKGGVGGAGREIYFVTTGQNNTGVNANNSRSKYGRLYRLTLSASDPLTGTLELLLDGDDRPAGSTNPARVFQNPDNILVTQNYVYIKEDPNGYGDETHDSYIYQYNIGTKATSVVAELDHRRTATDAPKFNPTGASAFGSWEYGAMVDISDVVGMEGTFMLSIQPHTWRAAKYAGVDGGTLRTTENQASQIVILRGLPR